MQGGYSDVSDLGAPGGTPMLLWTSSFRTTYSATRMGMLFNGWPDGKPAEEQPQVLLEVFDIMKDEAMAIMNEAARE
jgi:hypothetical protein